jgi:hypothetical protein
MRLPFAKADQRAAAAIDSVQGCAAAAARWRNVDRFDALGLDPLLLSRMDHAVADEIGQRLFVEVLKLAPAASPEMAARWRGMVGARQNIAVGVKRVAGRRERHMSPRRGDAITLGGDADDRFRFVHKAAA